MKWFGEHWGAPVLEFAERVPVPIGESCTECTKIFIEGDSGFFIPSFEPEGLFERPWHRFCFFASIFGEEKARKMIGGKDGNRNRSFN